MTDLEISEELFTRGVSSFVDPKNSFKEKLQKKLNGEDVGEIIVKFGADPTRPDIHLGHAVLLRKLRQLQDLGCKVVFLVGDFTARIGDPTGKSKVRPELEKKEIEENMQTYIDQAQKILRTDEDVFVWTKNSDWYENPIDLELKEGGKVDLTIIKDKKKITLSFPADSFIARSIIFEQSRLHKKQNPKGTIQIVSLGFFLNILRRITHQQLIDRDMFQNRLKEGGELFMHEMMYPVLQGIDSVLISKIFGSCDLEVGGTDQTFNMLMGRNVMRVENLPEQAVMSMDLLEGIDGKEKMSKSLDNFISISDEPVDMFGKVMSIPDELIPRYFSLATYTPEEDIPEIKKEIEEGHPMDLKKKLAQEIVEIYHGSQVGKDARESFENIFQKQEIPTDVLTVQVSGGTLLQDVLLDQKYIDSKSEFRRLVSEGAITNLKTEEKIGDASFEIEDDMVVRVGKKRFIKIEVS